MSLKKSYNSNVYFYQVHLVSMLWQTILRGSGHVCEL